MNRLTPTRYRAASRPRPTRDIDALFHSAFSGFPSLGSALELNSFFRPTDTRLPVEVTEKEDHYALRVEIPGVKRDLIEVTIDGRILSLDVFANPAEVELDADNDQRKPVRSRKLVLPESIEDEKISASLEDGILSLTLPKVAAVKARSIEIE